VASEGLHGTATTRCYPPCIPADLEEAPLLAVFQDVITNAVGENGYLAIFLLMLLGSACIPIPSEVTMLFGGALASAGFAAPGQELTVAGVVLWGVAGTVAGSWLAYWAGAKGGRPLVDRFGRYLLIRPHEVERAHAWFEKHGEAVTLYGRLVPLFRSFVSLPAGVAEMPFWRFTLYTVIGSIPWCVAFAILGRSLGDRWTQAERLIQPVAWIVAAVAVLGLAAFVARRWKQVRAEYAALDAERDA
jgi:membrane protein DedA with SNARE-associated domain